MPSGKYKLTIDMNVLNHLGINLYSNVPAILSELIANAWDADAEHVNVLFNKGANIEDSTITIWDDGIGMDEDDINDKFLKVGYQRRKNKGQDRTIKLNRPVMGRKGIGKLSVFPIAEDIRIYTKKEGNKVLGLRLKTSDLYESVEKEESYFPESIDTISESIAIGKTGTVIILSQLQKRMGKLQVDSLRKRVARRFSMRLTDFSISINGREVTIKDRMYFNKLEYVRIYDKSFEKYFNHIEDYKRHLCDGRISEQPEYEIKGWIGLSESSKFLQEEDINKISVIVRGRVVEEDILNKIQDSSLYTKYLIGEIEADFMDITGENDMITSNRENIVQDDEKFPKLIAFIKKELRKIDRDRRDFKTKEAIQEVERIDAIKKWLGELKGDNRQYAVSLFTKINQMDMENEDKRILYGYAVIAFEKLYSQDKLGKLNEMSGENIEDILKLFDSLDEVEASFYYQITRQRLETIEILREAFKENALEKILQKYIADHLWLLDPSWDRATRPPELEKYVKSLGVTGEENRGRIDILCRTNSGEYIIIELKRPSKRFKNTLELVDQIRKYQRGLKKYIEENGLRDQDRFEAICIVSTKSREALYKTEPEGKDMVNKVLGLYRIRLLTYSELMSNAEEIYKEYIEKQGRIGRLSEILDAIHNDVLN